MGISATPVEVNTILPPFERNFGRANRHKLTAENMFTSNALQKRERQKERKIRIIWIEKSTA